MRAHPSDRFIRDSGATIMATGYVYARLRSRVLYHRVGMVCTSRGFFDHYDRVRRDLEDRCTRPASPRLALRISDGSRAPLSTIYLLANISASREYGEMEFVRIRRRSEE